MAQKNQANLLPLQVSPMLATLVASPFDSPEWIYEVKWDGYRTLAFCDKKKVELKSRNNKSFNDKFYPVLEAVQQWNLQGIADGEIVVLDETGKPNFNALQNWRSEADGEIYFYVFDLLWLKGKSLMELPLYQRRDALKRIIPDTGIIRFSESFEGKGTAIFDTMKKMGMEGILAKHRDSTYSPGLRSKEWLKIKANKRQEMVIGGYTINDDTSKLFSSLLVGVFEKGKLIYTGKVGTGFNEKTQAELIKKFKPFITTTPPFTALPDINKPSRFRPNPPHARAVWLKPELVCEVSYAEMTPDGIMRHPSFEAMRIDKNPGEVVREKAAETNRITLAKGIIIPAMKKERKTLVNPTEETQVKKVSGHELKFTHLSKVYWPGDGITKRDLINYYYAVAPYILPYLKDRPQSLNRFPNGIKGDSFYQKDVTGKAPAWVKTYLYHSEADDRDRHYLVPTSEADILWMASLGSIEMNPWSSRVQKPDNPDWCAIDLDPDKNSFDQVIEAALVTKAILDDLGVPCYCKTSGSTGLHIYIPFGAKYSYEQSKEFARAIATLVHKELPKFTTIERLTVNRNRKMYIDFLQNRPQATLASVYSVRPKPGATVSMPLHWHEVKKGLKMKDFTLLNAMDRIRSEGDLFKPVLGKGIDLKKVIRKFDTK